jgi:CubicO group peptidase (beta-lactamase class C family)
MDTVQLVREMAESLQAGVTNGIFPGGICSLTVGEAPPLIVAKGAMSQGENADAMGEETVFDMASLTKVMVTLPLVLLSAQAGKLSLADPVHLHLPEWEKGQDVARKRQITLFHLLTHTSGLPAWRPYFLLGQGREAYLRLIAGEPLLGEPGKQVIYSDLGFMLLGFILERVWDEPLDLLAKRLIFRPSGMTMTTYKPLKVVEASRIAPTERGNAYERDMAERHVIEAAASGHSQAQIMKEQLSAMAWRKEIIRGEVHDGNCHYGLGGVSGHAGLFSTVRDAERYMRIWTTDAAEVRIDPLLRLFASRGHTDKLAPRRGLGWEASATGGTLEQAAAGCTGGDLISGEAFGHTGFTGTSIWHDPVRRATLITLTNRVHPEVSPLIGQWRRAHHNRVFSLVKPTANILRREERTHGIDATG